MAAPLPQSSVVWRAIDAYLARAYPGGTPPTAVRGRLDKLRAAGEAVLACDCVERPAADAQPSFRIRLGNQVYPHMKLAIELAPDGGGFLFRADAHDRHVQVPAGSPEAAAIGAMCAANQQLAAQVEADWAAQGVPTFKTYLRQDLARRRAATSAPAVPPATIHPHGGAE
jgi:hypothetical protein